MSKLNAPVSYRKYTHEGGAAFAHTSAEQQLRRSILSCLLFEDEFYEDGKAIADRIVEAAQAVPLHVLADLAVDARSTYNLRHAPLLLLTVLAQRGRGNSLTGSAIANTIQRADEITDFTALYAQRNGMPLNKIRPLSAQVKRGLAEAFNKFDEYQLAKYNRQDQAVKLRDVMFLVCPKPKDEKQAALFKKLAENNLATPDTWEVALSGGADKKEAFERLLSAQALGYLALLRNLRNMQQAGVDQQLIVDAILARKGAHRVLPFRYIAAARYAPSLEPYLDKALCMAIDGMDPMPGRTAILVDVSGSMDRKLSLKSDLTRIDAAAALAAIFPGNVRMFTFSNSLVEVPPRKGMSGVDAIKNSQVHSSTYLRRALTELQSRVSFDRLIVITDEQSQDGIVTDPQVKNAYLINVASNRNGVGYGKWVHIDGFSEQVIRYIAEYEKMCAVE